MRKQVVHAQQTKKKKNDFNQQLTEFKVWFQSTVNWIYSFILKFKTSIIAGWTNQQNKLVRAFFANILCRWIYVGLSHKYLSLVKLYSTLFYSRILESESTDTNCTGLDTSK